MKLIGSTCEIAFILIVADFLYVAQLSKGATDFRRCYNTTKMDMHCFDVQYNSNNRVLITSFDNARQRCEDLNSTLIIIKDEETNQFVSQFLTDYSNPIRWQYIWTNAYRINDYGKTYRWQWLNSTLPNLSASDVVYSDYTWYVAALGLKDERFTLMAQQPHFNNKYICEYAAANCSSVSSSSQRMFNGRCYMVTNEKINWYEARNWCLKGGGDLASFVVNVTNIDFTSWLGSDPYVRYWIGLRFVSYIWKESGEDVKFSKWTPNYDDWTSPCLSVCFNCNPNFSWQPKDCSIVDSIYVVCHTVTSLLPTTTITATTSTVPTITTTLTPAETSTALKMSQNADNPSSNQSKIQIGVGVGVGVGVPVIIAIALLAIFLIRRHRQKTPAQPSTQAHTDASTTEDQFKRNGGDEISTYAFVPASLSSKPTAAESDVISGTQYAALSFPEKDKSEYENAAFDIM